jgi:oxygen-independent coproporphyrinogen-3 oxidase
MAGKERLTTEQLMIEAIYLGLRTARGINLMEFEARTGINFANAFGTTIAELESRGMIEMKGGYCVLTRKGLLVIDGIASMFIGQEVGG